MSGDMARGGNVTVSMLSRHYISDLVHLERQKSVIKKH